MSTDDDARSLHAGKPAEAGGPPDARTADERGIRDPAFNFESVRRAFVKARERASVAAAMEAEALHLAIGRAREAGHTVRTAAAVLRVPKSTVDRHWRPGHRCPDVLPLWGSDAAWAEARAAVWGHDDRVALDELSPFRWRSDDGGRSVSRRPLGTAHARFVDRHRAQRDATTDERDGA